MSVTLNRDHLKGFVDPQDIEKIYPKVEKAHNDLHQSSGKGSDFIGWLNLPSRTDDKFLDELTAFGEEIRGHSDCIVSVGIGGSYIGIRSSLEYLASDQKIPVYYAGHNLSSGYLHHLLTELEDKRVTLVVISKSGTTTEPALAFRVLKKFMENKYSGEECKRRIICITDPKKGALKQIADENGYRTFDIPSDIGGRFSVLTPVGLVPLAMAGIDIKQMISGARKSEQSCANLDMDENIAYQYAASRYILYTKGKKIEVLSTFYQRLSFVEEWWKQLFGESEGKDGKGIFPASCNFTADLHSMGQLIQDGERNIFETFMRAENPGHELIVPRSENDVDNFNCVAGKDLDYVNSQAYTATAMAHYEGGVPNMTITVPRFDADSLGQLYYFFEKAVAMTGYLLDVNPFDQPGVEAYKSKMFQLLGRT